MLGNELLLENFQASSCRITVVGGERGVSW